MTIPESTVKRVARGLVVCALAWWAASPGHAQRLHEGDRAPDFVLEQLDGPIVALDDFLGQVVLISFIGYD